MTWPGQRTSDDLVSILDLDGFCCLNLRDQDPETSWIALKVDELPKTVKRRAKLTALSVAMLVALAACSSSGSGRAASSGSPSTGAAGSTASPGGGTSGGTIKVAMIGVFQSSHISLPDTKAAVQAGEAAVNAAGGINGRKLDVTFCDDQYDANTAANCAQQAVSDHAVAVIEGYEGFNQMVFPILKAAGIPVIYNDIYTLIDAQDPIAFPRGGGILVTAAASAAALSKAGCTKVVGIVNQSPSATAISPVISQALTKEHISYTSQTVPSTQVDFNATVAQVISQGAGCIAASVSPAQFTPLMKAVQQSGKTIHVSTSGLVGAPAVLAGLGSAADNVLLVGENYRATDTEVPVIQQITATMKQYTPGTALSTDFGVGAWGSITALAELLKAVPGAPTASAVYDKAKTFSFSSVVCAGESFSDPAPLPNYPRVRNIKYLEWTVSNGKATLMSQQFTDAPIGT